MLTVLPSVQVDELPRLTDFAKILAALDQVQGWSTFANFMALAAEITEADPFADAVRILIQTKPTWTGTAAALAELVIKQKRHRRGFHAHRPGRMIRLAAN